MSEELDRILADPGSAATWRSVQDVVAAIPGVDIEAKKTSLHVTRGRAFLGVRARRGGLLLNIVSSEQIVSPRVRKAEQLSARRWHNEVLLEGEVDSELAGWIVAAADLTP